MDRGHADSARAFGVGQHVVDEHRFVRREAACPACQLIDRGVGLGALDLARYYVIAEQAAERMALARWAAQPAIEEIGGAGQEIEWYAGGVQALDQPHHPRKTDGVPPVKALVDAHDQRLLAG